MVYLIEKQFVKCMGCFNAIWKINLFETLPTSALTFGKTFKSVAEQVASYCISAWNWKIPHDTPLMEIFIPALIILLGL